MPRNHRSALAESDGSLRFHSLEIGSAKTPEEWEENSIVGPSPKCKGGDGRGMKNYLRNIMIV